MTCRFKILGSGSSGNSSLLITPQARILVDAGFTTKKLEGLLEEAGESLGCIDAIFITHEHADHAAAIAGIKKYPSIKLFANQATARVLQEKHGTESRWQIFETGSTFRYRDLEIKSFSIPHDAHDPVGFCITTGHQAEVFTPGKKIIWLTDLGYVPDCVPELIKTCDIVVIEANHCPRMLELDMKRPWSLKNRISGKHGHLSNEEARDLLVKVSSPLWTQIYLTHLSRDCNSRERVEEVFQEFKKSMPCVVTIIDAGEGGPFYDIL
jgi:phosphoribosyl 1,2-cyclic phosphodiesterase